MIYRLNQVYLGISDIIFWDRVDKVLTKFFALKVHLGARAGNCITLDRSDGSFLSKTQAGMNSLDSREWV